MLLVEDLIQQDAGGNTEVERVARADHRDADHLVTGCLLRLGQAQAFTTHQQDAGAWIGQGPVRLRCLTGSSQNVAAGGLFPGHEGIELSTHKALCEHRAHAGTNSRRVICIRRLPQ